MLVLAGKTVTGLSPVSKWDQDRRNKETKGIKDKRMVVAHRGEGSLWLSLPGVRWAPTGAGLGGGSSQPVGNDAPLSGDQSRRN